MKQIILSLFLLFPLFLYAQKGIVTTGGQASGDEGSISYSIGQVFYQNYEGDQGSVEVGLQQPYEIFTVTSIEEAEDISLVFSAYPIPVVDLLFLEVKRQDTDNLSYRLFDFLGRFLKEGTIDAFQTTISMRDLDPAVYFLQINNQNKPVKTFRIVKSQ